MHKYGRQILAAWNAAIFAFLAYHKVPITPELIIAIGGPSALYTAMKGRGAGYSQRNGDKGE